MHSGFAIIRAVARRDLPSGTVTFLFTDVEGSTKLLHSLGAEAYADALAEHRGIVRKAVAAYDGVEVDTQGDAFFVAFPTAPGALAAAEEVRSGLADGPIRVRIGLHTGTPHLTDEGYVGPDVHRAARIAAAGHGGQILVGAATAQLVDSELRDLGLHRLKDLSAPERILQLGDEDHPPLKTLHQTNLPIPASTFIGRSGEMAELDALIARDDVRLVTLIGPGGTGKTRLALAAAAHAADDFPGGVWWVPLAPLRDAALVLDAAAKALGIGGELAVGIGDRKLLLLFDNFEQVVDAAPGLVDLLGACPNLKLIVTSRELLAVPGEHAYPVAPLEPAESEELFTARARAVLPGFSADVAVTELCNRLEHLPLALELAAARVRLLPPAQLVERLATRLDLLKAGRAADPRQQTLRATIEWSHDLLTPAEQQLFASLAVFRGGSTLTAIEEVCRVDLDTLQSLVDKSLVRVREGTRFWMLETIREYAAERLDRSGAADDIRRRHAEYYLALAESANLSVDLFAQAPQHVDWVLPELHNIRAAMDWATDEDVEIGLRLAVATEQLSWFAMDPREGMRRYEALLPRADKVPPSLYARAIRDYGGLADIAEDLDVAESAYSQARELFRDLGDEDGVATSTFRLGAVAVARGDTDTARRLWDESRDIWRRLGNELGEIQYLGFVAGLEVRSGDAEVGIELAKRSLAMAQQAGWTGWLAWRRVDIAEGELRLGRTEAGERHALDALAETREVGYRAVAIFGLSLLSWAAVQRGDLGRAALLWATVRAEEAKEPIHRWGRHRARHAARIPEDLPPAEPLPLEDAMEYALAT
jgi:predicted ATPase/class 3 adenylate cyclase